MTSALKLRQHMSLLLVCVGSLTTSLFLALTQSIRLDEAQTLWVTSKSFPKMIELISEDVHVPLYSILVHLLVLFTGPNLFFVRLLSIVFGALSFVALFHLAKRVSTDVVAFYTTAFFALSPFILWYNAEARMYSLFVLVSTLQQISFLKLLSSRGKRGRLVFVLLTTLGLYTHYFFIFLLTTQGLYLLFQAVRSAHLSRSYSLVQNITIFLHHSFLLRLFSVLILLALVGFFPWIWIAINQGAGGSTSPVLPPPSSFAILQFFSQLLFGFQAEFMQSFIISLWPLSVVIVFLFFTKKNQIPLKRAFYFLLAILTPVLLTVAASFIRPLFLPRYLIFIAPAFTLVFAWVITNLPVQKKLVSAVLLFFMFTASITQVHSEQTPVKEDYTTTAVYLEERATAEDIILVSAPFTVYPIEYVYTGAARIETIPRWSRYDEGGIPSFTTKDFEAQMEELKRTYRRVFVVLSYDQGYEDEIRAILDTRYGYEGHRKFSPGLEVREYRLRYDEPHAHLEG